MPSRDITSRAASRFARAATTAGAAAGGEAHHHDFLDGDGEVPVDGLELRHVADARAVARAVASDVDAAAIDVDRAEDRAQQRRLAGAARARRGRRSRRA